MSDKQKEYNYNNMLALDDSSNENLNKVYDMMEFLYQQAKESDKTNN